MSDEFELVSGTTYMPDGTTRHWRGYTDEIGLVVADEDESEDDSDDDEWCDCYVCQKKAVAT